MSSRYTSSTRAVLRFSFIGALLCAFNLAVLGAETQQSVAELEFQRFKVKAEQGDAYAQYELYVDYTQGWGVEQDLVEGSKWLRKVAEQGNPNHQCQLGICYFTGQGVERDYKEAVKWLRKAADQNDRVSRSYLGYSYELGLSVNKDYAEAYAWYCLADEPVPSVVKDRERLEKMMSPEQLAAGKKRTTELRAQIAAKRPSGKK